MRQQVLPFTRLDANDHRGRVRRWRHSPRSLQGGLRVGSLMALCLGVGLLTGCGGNAPLSPTPSSPTPPWSPTSSPSAPAPSEPPPPASTIVPLELRLTEGGMNRSGTNLSEPPWVFYFCSGSVRNVSSQKVTWTPEMIVYRTKRPALRGSATTWPVTRTVSASKQYRGLRELHRMGLRLNASHCDQLPPAPSLHARGWNDGPRRR